MTKRVTIVDYGLGNLHSVIKSVQHFGAEVEVADTAERVSQAERLILPGVGAFGDGIGHLRNRGQDRAILDYAAKERPLLGICLGAQLLLDESEEFGRHHGLGLIPGKVTEIPREHVRVPHAGWGKLVGGPVGGNDPLLREIPEDSWMYFVHSFQLQPAAPSSILRICQYGPHPIPAVVKRGLVYGCQFHPEKSGKTGLILLRNFLDL